MRDWLACPSAADTRCLRNGRTNVANGRIVAIQVALTHDPSRDTTKMPFSETGMYSMNRLTPPKLLNRDQSLGQVLRQGFVVPRRNSIQSP